ncbi:hypothetical protein VKT23_009807 [Stygiomarasmius scandens]|uniref:DUF7330 domain-containing protein n=1 Tax=Marasmiellus scandens TaxID=2682957 RepID=A0ABR1JE93_9AGAR
MLDLPTINASEVPPPDYTSALGSDAFRRQNPSISSSQSVNYLSINQLVGSIECTHILDPSLHIPESLLPPLAIGETEWARKNLSLKGKLGAVEADITLHCEEPQETTNQSKFSTRVNMEVQTSVGAISVKLRDPPTPSVGKRWPFHLSCSTHIGQINLFIPRSFQGFIDVSTTVGHVVLAPDVTKVVRWTDSKIRRRRCFLGALVNAANKESIDEVVLNTLVGSVEIAYVDGTVS